MDEENRKKYESTFIPCGDALEKMELFADETPETEAESLKDADKQATA